MEINYFEKFEHKKKSKNSKKFLLVKFLINDY